MSTVFPNFYNLIKTQFDVGIQRFRSDNAKDYFNLILSYFFFQKHGIIYEPSCVSTPQQNGVAERKNGHFLATTRTLLFHKKVPKQYWRETVLTAIHLINRLPKKVLKLKSLMETLTKFFLNFKVSNNLIPRIFESIAYVHVHFQNQGKLDPRALKCVFVGYSSTQKGYKCFHPTSKKYFISADVTFVEIKSYFQESYLKGESLSEDREKDLFLLEFPITTQSIFVEPVSPDVESETLFETPKSKGMVKEKEDQNPTQPQ